MTLTHESSAMNVAFLQIKQMIESRKKSIKFHVNLEFPTNHAKYL